MGSRPGTTGAVTTGPIRNLMPRGERVSVDYLDSAERHRTDAEHLFKSERWPNADQLYGLAAECGLKAIMQALGMLLRPDGAPQEAKYRVHVDKLWGEFLTFANGISGMAYASLLPQDCPFQDWSIEQRYHHSAAIPRERVAAHRAATKQVFDALGNARVDGRL